MKKTTTFLMLSLAITLSLISCSQTQDSDNETEKLNKTNAIEIVSNTVKNSIDTSKVDVIVTTTLWEGGKVKENHSDTLKNIKLTPIFVSVLESKK